MHYIGTGKVEGRGMARLMAATRGAERGDGNT